MRTVSLATDQIFSDMTFEFSRCNNSVNLGNFQSADTFHRSVVEQNKAGWVTYYDKQREQTCSKLEDMQHYSIWMQDMQNEQNYKLNARWDKSKVEQLRRLNVLQWTLVRAQSHWKMLHDWWYFWGNSKNDSQRTSRFVIHLIIYQPIWLHEKFGENHTKITQKLCENRPMYIMKAMISNDTSSIVQPPTMLH